MREACYRASNGAAATALPAALALAGFLLSAPPAGSETRPAAERDERAPEVAAAAAGRVEAVPEPLEAAVDATATDPAEEVFDELLVTGGPSALERLPGSADYLGGPELSRREHGDIHRVLRLVPGVQVQEEEGYGLRPNIGMRGSGVERSQKITLLEDGVLIAPAPYSAPAAYYFPTTGRMAAIEVRKGSSAVRQGPFTNGGVLNLISSPIPAGRGGRMRLAAGSDETARLHARVGGSRERLGWGLETYQLTSDGFKRLDGGGPTGVRLGDYVGKLRWNSRSGARVGQVLEVKLGYADQTGHETYLGLTEADFERDPFRRYAASQRDRIDSEHEQIQLRYFLQPSPRFDLTATVYRNDFFRNWHKLQSVSGAGIAELLAAPERYPRELGLLRGELAGRDGELVTRNNRRDYYSEGLEAVAGIGFETGAWHHRLRIGLRLHRDGEDRFQEEARWNIVDGQMRLVALAPPGSQSNRISEARAAAGFLSDEITAGRWTLSPGVRFESIDFERRDFGRSDPARTGAHLERRSSGVDVLVPGIGVSFAASSSWVVFAGAHRGFAPPGPGQSREAEAEESLNLEAGFRYRGRDLASRLVAFHSDYDNLLGRDTLSSGGEGSGEAFNGGRVEVAGLEAGLEVDPGERRGWRRQLPLRLAYTWTSARFRSSFETGFADWAPRVEAGDELPYLPEHQVQASAGLVGARLSAVADLTWSPPARTKPGRGPLAAGEGTGELLTVDLSLRLRLRHNLELTAQVLNVTDRTVLVARRPAGLRPGLPRTALVGLDWEL